MSLFEKIVHFLDAQMATPTLYGTFHLISLVAVVLVTAFLIFKFRNASDKTFRIIVYIFWVLIFWLEVYKQINFSFNYNDGAPYWDYQWYAFPFQFCSLPLYVLPFIVFMKEGRLRDAFISFMCYFCLLGGFVVMAYPGDVFIGTIGINIQTMLHHGSQVILGIYFAVYKRKKIGIKFWASGLPIILVFIAVAIAINIGVHQWMLSAGIDECFNMFYISPYYNSHLPVFSTVQSLVPYPVYILLYIFAVVLGGLLVLAIQKGIAALYRKVKSVFHTNKITAPVILFFVIEVVLAVLIQLSPGDAERMLCFSSVALAALFAIFTVRKNACSILTVLGLIFTVAADVFLVLLTDGDKLLAMYLFSLVQIFYFLRVFMENNSKRTRACHLVLRVLLLSLSFALVVFVLGEKADLLSIVSVLYFANLVVNIIFSFANFKRAKKFAIGLLLFAFCDILVGFSMLDLYITVSESSLIYRLNHTAVNLIWAFYVPAQTLISLSARSTEKQ